MITEYAQFSQHIRCSRTPIILHDSAHVRGLGWLFNITDSAHVPGSEFAFLVIRLGSSDVAEPADLGAAALRLASAALWRASEGTSSSLRGHVVEPQRAHRARASRMAARIVLPRLERQPWQAPPPRPRTSPAPARPPPPARNAAATPRGATNGWLMVMLERTVAHSFFTHPPPVGSYNLRLRQFLAQ